MKLVNYLPEKAINYRSPRETLNIALYELGGVAKSLIYSWYKPELEAAYLAEARVGLGDLIIMARLAAEQLGFDRDTLEVDAEERFRERCEEVTNETL